MSGSRLRSQLRAGRHKQLAAFLVAVPLLAGVTMVTDAPSGRVHPSLTGYPPIIEVTKPPDGSTRHSQTTEIRLDYYPDPACDLPQFPDQPDPCGGDESTLQVWVNGVEETSEFTTHGGWANSTSVVMPDDQWSTIRGKICNDFGCDEDTTQVYIETKPAPVVSLLPTDDQVLDRGLCASLSAGPAATWGCDEWVTSHSTIPYYSLGAPRAVKLVYTSQLAYPHVLIRADVAFPWESTVPDTLSAQLWLNGASHGKEIFYSTSGVSTADSADTRRVVLPLNAEGLAPGRHSLKFVAWSLYGATAKEGYDSIGFAYDTVVATKISRGWAIAGLARVQEDGQNLIWSDGAGTVHYYLKEGQYSYYKIEGVLAEIESVGGTAWKRTLPDGTVEHYNSSGQLSWIKGVNPADTTWFYYNGALIDSIVDRTAQKIEFKYNGPGGRLSTIVYPGASGNDTTKLSYDGSNRLYRIYDPDGRYTEFSYSGSSYRITSRRDRSAAVTSYTWYDYTPRVRRVVLPVNSDSLVYAAAQLKGLADTTVSGLSPSNPAPTPPKRSEVAGSIRDPRGYTSTFCVNEFGSLLKWKDPLDRVTTYERDANSLVTKRVGPDSAEFKWHRFPELGLLWWTNDISTDSAVRWVLEGPYENCNGAHYPCHPIKEIRSRGYGEPMDTTSYYYAGDRLSQVTHPGGGTTSYSYQGAFSQLSQITDPAGHKKKLEYDSNTGHLLRQFKEWGAGSQGDTATYWYDGKGRVIRETVDVPGGAYPYGRVYTEYEYDELNRVTKVHRVEKWTKTEVRHTVTYSYDDANRKLTVTDPKGQSQVFTYDALGRLIRRDDPASAYETFAYDANGNMTSWSTRRDTTITYSYDVLDRLISKNVPGVGTTTYGYHALRGTLDTIFTPSAKNIREFDARGRILLDSSWVAGISGWRAVRYTYDAQGNLKTLTDPWGDEWTYDPRAEPETWTPGFHYKSKSWVNAFGDTTTWDYDSDGLLARVSHANSQRDTVVRDERHRINQLGDVSYTRGARGGRIDQMTVANPTDDRVVKYEYDFRNQLIEEWDSVAGQVPVTRTFAYDSAGNRTGAGYVHATGNRLLATPADTFAYDASGNLTWWKNKSTGHYKTFTWDAEGRLIRVKLYDSYSFNYRTVTFTYDGLGRRVKKLVTVHLLSETDTVRYVWNGRQVLAELDGSGTWTLRYTQHPTQVDRTIGVRTASGSSYFLHHDKVGNVVKVTDSSGTVVSQYRYDAFGKRTVVGTEGYASKRLWQGREYDAEAGLYYFRARYYALQIGRFIQEDPIGIAAELNLYRFGTNDPVNSTDPSGLCPPGCADSWATIGRAVGAAVGAVAGGVLVGSAGVGVCSPTGPAAVACGGEGAVIGSALLGATGMKVGEAVGRLGGSAVDAIHGAGLWSPPNWLTVVLELWNAIFVKEQTPQPPVIPDDGGPTTEQVEPPPGGGGGDGNDEDNGG